VVKTLISKIHDKKILSIHPVSGGDINSAFQLTLVDGTQLFMKRNSLPFFELEAKGLEAIRNTKTIRVPR
jgi:fructosamine-3-kinase